MLIILDGALTVLQVNEPLLVQINDTREALAGRNLRDIDHPFIRGYSDNRSLKRYTTYP